MYKKKTQSITRPGLRLLRADTQTRTEDPRITNALLYQLSYIGETEGKVTAFY